MSTLWSSFSDAPVSSQERVYRPDPIYGDGWVFLRLGASIQELADDAYQELVGHPSGVYEKGHKPARADLQKLRDIWKLWEQKQERMEHGHDPDMEATRKEAEKEWDEKYGMTDLDQALVTCYMLERSNLQARGGNLNDAFDETIRVWMEERVTNNTGLKPDTPEEVKRELGQALKKYEGQKAPSLSRTITNGLTNLHDYHPESYKMWPWFVKNLKQAYNDSILDNHNQTSFNSDWGGVEPPIWTPSQHMTDVVGAVGKTLNQLRQDHRIPQNFDVNQMNFKELEDWFMDWKKENRGSLAQGHVVYQYHDGWTMQKLENADQLQYEGDEMGHCVGDYSNYVESGETIIYSLRDPKGRPHVTIEIEAIHHTGPGGEDSEFAHPDSDRPEDIGGDEEDGGERPEPTFEVVQVQGNSNKTPKPEYQRKVKEFLDSLRERGWNFERSPNWFHNFDDPRQEQYGEGRPDSAETLREWYSDHYQENYGDYHGNKGDAYGMPAERITPGVDWEEMFQSIIHSLVEHGDRGSYKTSDWAKSAQTVYHAWCVDIHKDELSPEALEKHKDNLLSEIQKAEDKLNEWEWENNEYAVQEDDIWEKFEAVLKKDGTWEKFEQALEAAEEEAENAGNWFDEKEFKRDLVRSSEWEDDWIEAEQEANDEANEWFSGNAHKFCGYLYMLAEKNGLANPADLPDPNQTNGGLPSRDDLDSMPWPGQQENLQTRKDNLEIPGTFASWRESVTADTPITIHPIDQDHNVWFDEDGGKHVRYRPGWAKHPETGLMEQTGELEDTFADKEGRQGQGFVAYNDDVPVGSMTYVSDPNGWHMLGTTYVHPDFRNQGIFSQMVKPLRDSGQPIDAYVWNNPWLKNKVRGWR